MKLTEKKVVIFTMLWWLSCTTPVQVPDQTDPIERIDFEYIQARGEVYVGVLVKDPFNGVEVKKVKVDWFGESDESTLDIHGPEDPPNLNDDGTHGDILVGDDLYGGKWSWSRKKPDPDKDQSVYFKVSVLYKEEGNPVEKDTSFILGNSSPQFKNICIWEEEHSKEEHLNDPHEVCEGPFVLTLPTEGVAKIITIEAKVSDLNSDLNSDLMNGFSDIQWVGFTSKDIAKDIMLNDGNYVYLLDDGPDEVSGDIDNGDEFYTRKVAFTSNATPGSLEWKFRAQDWQGGFAESIITVTVQK